MVLFGIVRRMNFVCLNAHHDENASYSTCSLIMKAVQMVVFDRELINPLILWIEMQTFKVEDKKVWTLRNVHSCVFQVSKRRQKHILFGGDR